VVKGGKRRYDELDEKIARGEELTDAEQAELSYLDADPSNTSSATEPKFSAQTTPGGDNYREVLLTLPMEKELSSMTDEQLFREYNRLRPNKNPLMNKIASLTCKFWIIELKFAHLATARTLWQSTAISKVKHLIKQLFFFRKRYSRCGKICKCKTRSGHVLAVVA